MNVTIQSRFGRALYEALPEVYRTRDDREENKGHLAAYLDSCGELLDAIYNSLDQRYKDCFPETCQEWLLPYFAQLVGASTLSPHTEGRRREIMHAVAWRQGKGTLGTIDQIAREIGGFEKLVIQEGWRRVARTANVDGPFSSPEIVDLHRKSARDFIGHRNTAPHSLDVRRPGWLHGHANPHAALLHALPYAGFFTDKEVVRFKWKCKTVDGTSDIDSWFDKGNGSILPSDIMELEYDGKTWFLHKKPGITETIHVAGDKEMKGKDVQYRFAQINLDGSLGTPTGTAVLLEKLAAYDVTVRNVTTDTPHTSLVANDCLLRRVKASNSLVRLEYCTVLGEMFAEFLEASDCIFMETLYKNEQKRKSPEGGIGIRYSRHDNESAFGDIVGNTTEMPVFYTTQWGEPGCGVIHPVSPESIRNGAEDGGEMGAFHHRAYALAWEAVIQKLNDYLPVGMGVALIPDNV